MVESYICECFLLKRKSKLEPIETYPIRACTPGALSRGARVKILEVILADPGNKAGVAS
jgi:hypothetical protein